MKALLANAVFVAKERKIDMHEDASLQATYVSQWHSLNGYHTHIDFFKTSLQGLSFLPIIVKFLIVMSAKIFEIGYLHLWERKET